MQGTKSTKYAQDSFQSEKFCWELDRGSEACCYVWNMKFKLSTEKNNTERFSCKFGLPSLWYREQNQSFVTSILLYNCNVLNWGIAGWIRTCNGVDIRVWVPSENNIKSNFRNFRADTNLKQWSKEKFSQLSPRQQMEIFWWRPYSEKPDLQLLRNLKLNSELNQCY